MKIKPSWKRFIDSRLQWGREAPYGSIIKHSKEYKECKQILSKMTVQECSECFLAYYEVSEKMEIFLDENQT